MILLSSGSSQHSFLRLTPDQVAPMLTRLRVGFLFHLFKLTCLFSTLMITTTNKLPIKVHLCTSVADVQCCFSLTQIYLFIVCLPISDTSLQQFFMAETFSTSLFWHSLSAHSFHHLLTLSLFVHAIDPFHWLSLPDTLTHFSPHILFTKSSSLIFHWSDLEIPAPGSEDQLCDTPSEVVSGPRLTLTLRGPNLPGIPDVDVPITKKSSTIFTAVQTLVHAANFPSRQERLRRIWEPTYT